MLNIAPIADAPIVDANVNDGADPDGLARNVTPTPGAEGAPSLAALDDGRTILVWQRGVVNARVVGQIFAADGTPEGPLFLISTMQGAWEVGPVVAGKPDGSFAVSWINLGASTGGGDIFTAFFNPGSTTPDEISTSFASGGFGERAPAIAALPDGWVITATGDGGGGTDAIHALTYAADFTPGTPVVVLPGAGDGAVAAIGAAGDFVVVGRHSDGSIKQTIVSGGIAGPAENVFDGPGGIQPVTARLADGGHVAVWTHDDGAGNQDLQGRIYDSSGIAEGPAIFLTSTPFSSEFSPEVAALPDGRFVVAWVGRNGVGPSQDIFARTFSADGTPAGDVLAVTETGLTATPPFLPIPEVQPTIAVLSDGQFTVGWVQVRATGGINPDVFIRTYTPSEASVAGIAGLPIQLPTTISLGDTDGSEFLLQVRIQAMPAGFTLPVGQRESADPTSDWIIDRSSAEESDFLDGLATGAESLTVMAPVDYIGALTVQIVATSQEDGYPSQTADSAVAFVPMVISEPASINLNGTDDGPDTFAAFTEDGPGVAIAPRAIIAGGEGASLAGATLTIASTASGEAEDALALLGEGFSPGEIGVIGTTVTFGGTPIGSVTGAGAVPLVVTFEAAATLEAVQAVLRRIYFDNGSETPSELARKIDVTFAYAGGLAPSQAEAIVGIIGIDDPGIARDDATAVDENRIVTGNLFADNGSGADGDPEGPRLTAVNGLGISVETVITLGSGARLTVSPKGDFVYDPRGTFDYLVSSSAGAGSSSATDGFTYTLANGNAAIVTVTINGIDGNDLLIGTPGNNNIFGGIGKDTMMGRAAHDHLDGGTGNDQLFGEGGEDDLNGGAGRDSLDGGKEDDILNGGSDADVLNGGKGADTMTGGAGNDSYRVDNVGDLVIELAGGGKDGVLSTISYTLPNQVEQLRLLGGGGQSGRGNALDNEIIGNAGNNYLSGNAGNDRIAGGDGDDTITGGRGLDILIGGSGTDEFLFNTGPAKSNTDRIYDYAVGEDRIVLDGDAFTRIAGGTLGANAFHLGTSAGDADDRILYDAATGKIFYDADGSGAAAAILFAAVSPGLPLTHADFLVQA